MLGPAGGLKLETEGMSRRLMSTYTKPTKREICFAKSTEQWPGKRQMKGERGHHVL